MSCLDNIIGITRSNCECITNPLLPGGDPDWYKESVSDLFLDELPGIAGINALSESGNCSGEVSTIYKNAIEQAKKDAQDEFLRGLTERYRQANKLYTGRAGGVRFTANEPGTGKIYAGIKINNTNMRGGMLKLKTILCHFATPPTALHIYRVPFSDSDYRYQAELVVSFTGLTITPNVSFAVPVAVAPATLDLTMDGYQYFILYEAAGVVAKNTMAACGCGKSEDLMTKYLKIEGYAGNDLLALNTWHNTGFCRTCPAHGLAVDLVAGCDPKVMFCDLYESEEVFKAVIPRVILFRAGYLVMMNILYTTALNEFTMNSRESMFGVKNTYDKQYNDRIAWMVENVALAKFTDCFECNEYNKQLRKINLLSRAR